MAPEIWSGEPATPKSDIYALGVVLFQVLIQDFQMPVPADWKDLISDQILVEDLERCLAGNPQKRFQSAALLGSSIRAFTQRKEELYLRQQEAKQRERAAYRLGIFRTALAGGTVAIILLGLVAFSYAKHHQALRALARESAARQEAEIAAGQERKARRIEFSSILHVLFVELSKINHENIKDISLQFAEKGDFLISLQKPSGAQEGASAIFYTPRYLDLLIFLSHALAIEKERPGFLKNALLSIQGKDDFEIADLYRSENWTEKVLDGQAKAFNSLAAFSLALELEFYDQGLRSKYRDPSGRKQIADLATAQEWQKGFTNAVNDMAKTEIDLEPWNKIELALVDTTPLPAWANLFAHPAPTANSK
jgi:serine/threonine protein kinase